ncbi:hypothetical protein EBME_0219 [bacterium endosymbiont of Mortierella elongata FMR23-6]|nr:hypothetical protein EBME_0219 [bacterium endosymbiont of Mortierella elongata FMR23-6]
MNTTRHHLKLAEKPNMSVMSNACSHKLYDLLINADGYSASLLRITDSFKMI